MDMSVKDRLPGSLSTVDSNIETKNRGIRLTDTVSHHRHQLFHINSFLGGHGEEVRRMPNRQDKHMAF